MAFPRDSALGRTTTTKQPAPALPFVDPIATALLNGQPLPTASLGAFPESRGLGFTIPVLGIDTDDAGDVWNFASDLFGGGAPSDPLEAITDRVPPEAINAHVGEGGWWYDNATNAKLSHEEASKRQHAYMAAFIGATVDPDGYWRKNGQVLTHAQAYALYQQKVGGGAPTQHGAPDPTPFPVGAAYPTSGPMVSAGGNTFLLVAGIAAVAGVVLLSRKRR